MLILYLCNSVLFRSTGLEKTEYSNLELPSPNAYHNLRFHILGDIKISIFPLKSELGPQIKNKIKKEYNIKTHQSKGYFWSSVLNTLQKSLMSKNIELFCLSTIFSQHLVHGRFFNEFYGTISRVVALKPDIWNKIESSKLNSLCQNSLCTKPQISNIFI